jgi:hypothetical protein
MASSESLASLRKELAELRPDNNANEYKARRIFLKEEIDRQIKMMQKQRKIEKELHDKEEFVSRVCNRCEEVKEESPRNESRIAKVCDRCESEKLDFIRIREDLMKEYSEEAHQILVQYNQNRAAFNLAEKAAEDAREAAAPAAARAALKEAEKAAEIADEKLQIALFEHEKAMAEHAKVLENVVPPAKKSGFFSWFKKKGGGRKTRRQIKKSKKTRRN